MKIIKFILSGVLALILIAGTGIFIFLETFDTDQYLPQITKNASIIAGRPVYIGHLGVGFSWAGLTLDAGPLTIADDPAFTTQPFIQVDRVRVSMDLRALVFQRQVHITGVLLESPEIHFIRSREGSFNVSSIAGRDYRGKLPVLAVAKSAGNRAQSSIIPNEPTSKEETRQAVSSIRVRDGLVSFIDQSQTMPLDIWLTNINANLKDFSLSDPFLISLDACLYSNIPNIHLRASVSGSDLSKRSIQISDLKFFADLTQLDADEISDISPVMTDNPIIKDRVGMVQLNMAHIGGGPSGDITANGGMIVTAVLIKDFNAIKAVLSHTLGVFGPLDNVIGKLGVDDTMIDEAKAQFSIHDKTLFIDDSLIKTNILEFAAKGSLDHGLKMDMQTMLHLNQDISASLINNIGELKFFCDDSQRITIGASLKGVFPHLKYKPDKDFKKKSKKAFMEGGGNILGVLKSFL